MKLHTVFITYNRLELTKQAVASFLETVTVPFTLSVVDNASSDGTREWIMFTLTDLHPHTSHLLSENRYPGFACNLGWSDAPRDADFLQRADNDWVFLPGWCEEVEQRFRVSKVGQVGLRTQAEEPVSWNVGGNNVIRRKLWEKGLRYDERPWTQLPRGHSEDTYLSPAVRQMGYRWGRVKRPCIRGISQESISDPYYRKSWRDRRITPGDQRKYTRRMRRERDGAA